MTWGAIGGAAVGAGANYLLNSGGRGGGGGQQSSGYVPMGLAGADTGWQANMAAEQNLIGQASGQAQPGFLQTLQQQQGMNYNPYLQASQQAGQEYGALGGMAAGGAQNMYGAANRIGQTAFDPQNQLFGRMQQQLGEQVNVGQAQRGLGTSAAGGAEYNQAMSNLDIDWQNQQLQRQMQGAQAMAGAQQAGGQQGAAAGNFMQQAGQVPMQAQQYVAGQPAAAAAEYAKNMGGLQSMYGTAMGEAGSYMGQGIGASQHQAQFGADQNAATANLFGNLGTAAINSPQGTFSGVGNSLGNTFSGVGNWLGNMYDRQQANAAYGGSTGFGGMTENIPT
jgi:hypothetical protein